VCRVLRWGRAVSDATTPTGKLSRHYAAREVSRLAAGLYYPSPRLIGAKNLNSKNTTMFDSWEESTLEAVVEVVEEDRQLAKYET
jgi:fructose-1,6-bisphosphatase